MRTNLIMHLHCAECGSVLRLAYPEEANAKRPESYGGDFDHDREPTGAEVRYIEPIMVVPCRHCIERHTGPAKQLASAIQALTSSPTHPTT